MFKEILRFNSLTMVKMEQLMEQVDSLTQIKSTQIDRSSGGFCFVRSGAWLNNIGSTKIRDARNMFLH